jgi:hypothetical protein
MAEIFFHSISDVISSIDKILQQEIHCIESDGLKLYYNGHFIQETNAYFDLTRPWNSETTFSIRTDTAISRSTNNGEFVR